MLRTLLAAALFSAAEVALPFIGEIYMVPRGLFAALAVIATGEMFAHPDSNAPIRKARFSPDGQYHRCTPNGERGAVYTICLFIPRAAES